jgi:two-component system, NtrC family, nitrogen regulation response regulator GlnG
LPGNVRQLENLCNWITVMAPGQVVEVKDLPPELIEGSGSAPLSSMSPAPLAANAPVPVMAGVESANGSVNAHGMSVGAPVQLNPAPYSAPLVGMPQTSQSWIALLETEAANMLSSGRPEVMDALGRQFESALIKTALRYTHGRKNDAAIRLGIGRNTITRKIHELGIDGAKEE